MSLLELFLVAVALSMDAFAVSVCKGLSVVRVRPSHALTVGLYFGGFQALMPALGYLLGSQFLELIREVDHYIIFVILGYIGFSMIREARSGEVTGNCSFGFMAMLPMALATSIDALAVGVTLALLQVKILPAVLFIGIITFILSCVGIKIGNVFGAKYKTPAETAGGVVLILMGTRVLLSHLGVIG